MRTAIKEILNERLFNRHSQPQVDVLNNFIEFASQYLKIKGAKVNLKFTRDGLVTTANYGNNEVQVYAKERALVDIMRSIAHELTHMKQDQEGRLQQTQHEKNNAAGSPIENEANFTAGELIRKYGEQHPEIYT